MVSLLCEMLEGLDVTKFSLEMQMWWRDHQAADKARIKKETALATEKEVALAKLTAHERRILGL
jgi:hypothetical protein